MPEIEGSYKTVKVGHKVKVKSDVKPFIKNAKTVDWYYAIQYIGEDGKVACMLMTEAAFKSGKVKSVKSNIDDPSLGKLEKDGIRYRISLYDENDDYVCVHEFYVNEIIRAIERAKKYPHLCTAIPETKKMGFFARLFSK